MNTPRDLCPFGTESDEAIKLDPSTVEYFKTTAVKTSMLYGGKGNGDMMLRRHKGQGTTHSDGAGKLVARETFPGFEQWNQ